jgi:hypothetical protein
MVSPLAMCEVKSLTKSGANLSPDEIVRLNDLGVAVERAKRAGDVVAAPRVAWAGSVLLHQPTIQSEQWYREYALDWWAGKSTFFALAWTAHAEEPGFFDQWRDMKKTRAAIVAWWPSLACTVDQMKCAVDYCISGTSEPWRVPGESEKQPADEALVSCEYTRLVNQALSAGFGIQRADLLTMTPGSVLDIINRWTRRQIALAGGQCDISEEMKSSALVSFYRYTDHLRKTHGIG